MKFCIFATLLAAISSVVALTVDTPTNVVECQPVLVTWRDGTAPFWLIAIPGGQPAAPAIKSWDQTSDTSLTWIVDIPAGTSVNLAIRDSTGTQAFSSIFTINAGTGSCSSGSSGGGSFPPVPIAHSDPPTQSTASADASPSSTAPARDGPSTENAARTSSSSTGNRGNANTNKPTSSSSGSNSSPSNSGATRSEVAVFGLAGVVAMGLAVL